MVDVATLAISLSQYPAKVRATLAACETDEERVDLLGVIRSVERHIADQRKMTASEIEAGTKGEMYVIEQGRTCERSYNTSSLLLKIMKSRGDNMIETILYLIEKDILRVSWQYKKLMALADKLGLTITIAKNQYVNDGDKADMGEIWKDGTPSYEGVIPEEMET